MKPEVGQLVRVIGEEAIEMFRIGRIVAVYDTIEEWWVTPTGENKVALMDALEEYGPDKAQTAEWCAEIVNVDYDSESMAVASFEVELLQPGSLKAS